MKMTKKDYKKFSVMSPDMIKKFMNLPREKGIELIKRVNYNFYLEKENILKQAFDENLITKKEYEEKYKDMFYDDYGSDSFLQYINAVMNTKVDCFVTENERMLKRNTCPKCGRIYFMKIAEDGSIVEPCPVCLGLFDEDEK